MAKVESSQQSEVRSQKFGKTRVKFVVD